MKDKTLEEVYQDCTLKELGTNPQGDRMGIIFRSMKEYADQEKAKLQTALDEVTETAKDLARQVEEQRFEAAYWKRRCELAEICLDKSPCDPDITKEQITAHANYNESLQRNMAISFGEGKEKEL